MTPINPDLCNVDFASKNVHDFISHYNDNIIILYDGNKIFKLKLTEYYTYGINLQQ